jgi:integral membrane sensor domain MASE1
MKYFKDRLLLALVGLLILTVGAFLAGVLPYPFGFLILLLLIVARLLSRQ